MSLTQTYLLAHKARAKLAGEASRPDHDLRRLVLHANTLDGLMLELADAEREQESWFNQSVRGATTTPAAAPAPAKPSAERHIQWADAPRVEQPDHDWQSEDDSSDDDDSEFDEDEDIVMADFHSLTRVPSRGHLTLVAPTVGDLDYDAMDVEADVVEADYYEDDEEDLSGLALHRTPSHSAPSSPPELLADDIDEDSEDESMTPPSPPTEEMPAFAARQHKPAVASSPSLDARQEEDEVEASAAEKHALFSESYYLRPRGAAAAAAAAATPAPGLVTAISVY